MEQCTTNRNLRKDAAQDKEGRQEEPGPELGGWASGRRYPNRAAGVKSAGEKR